MEIYARPKLEATIEESAPLPPRVSVLSRVKISIKNFYYRVIRSFKSMFAYVKTKLSPAREEEKL